MPILERLRLFFTAINYKSDSVFQRSMLLPQRERGFIVVDKNGVIYAKNIVTSPDENAVTLNWFLKPGEKLIGQGHTHQDPSTDTLNRPGFSDDDLINIKFAHGHHTQKNYITYIECGNVRYVMVIEDPAKAIAFYNSNTNDSIYSQYKSLLKINLNYHTNYQLAGVQTIQAILISANNSGIGLYKSINSFKTEFIKLN